MDAGQEHRERDPRVSVATVRDGDLDEHRALLLGVLDGRRRKSRVGCRPDWRPAPVVGWEILEAGYRTFRELAAAVPVSFEFLSRLRAGDAPMSPKLRSRLAELLDVHEDWILVALRRAPGPRWRW